MKSNEDYSMAVYLRRRLRDILNDEQRDIKLQNYFCSFILPYWDSILKVIQKKIINTFLSNIFNIPEPKIEKYLNALDSFKNATNLREECLNIKVE